MVGPSLSGDKVNLRPLTAEDLRHRVAWLNDEETFRLFTGALPTKAYGMNEAETWRVGLEKDPAAIVWAVDTKDGRHIGDLDIHGIDRFAKSAKLTILLGDKSSWGQGYGADTILTALRHLFTETNLQKIDLRVFEFNVRGINCYRKCGFLTIWTTSGRQGDPPSPPEVHMSITKEHFLARYTDGSIVQS